MESPGFDIKPIKYDNDVYQPSRWSLFDPVKLKYADKFTRKCIPRKCTCVNGSGTEFDKCAFTLEDLRNLRVKLLPDIESITILDPVLYNLDSCQTCNPGYHLEKVDYETMMKNSVNSDILNLLTIYNMDLFIGAYAKKLNQMSNSTFVCQPNICQCKFGIPASGENCPVQNGHVCDSCFNGYRLDQEQICQPKINLCSCRQSRLSHDSTRLSSYQCPQEENLCKCGENEYVNQEGVCQLIKNKMYDFGAIVNLQTFAASADFQDTPMSITNNLCNQFKVIEVDKHRGAFNYTIARETCKSYGMTLPTVMRVAGFEQDFLTNFWVATTEQDFLEVFPYTERKNLNFWLGVKSLKREKFNAEWLNYPLSPSAEKTSPNFLNLSIFNNYFQTRVHPFRFYWDVNPPFDTLYIGEDISYEEVSLNPVDLEHPESFCGLATKTYLSNTANTINPNLNYEVVHKFTDCKATISEKVVLCQKKFCDQESTEYNLLSGMYPEELPSFCSPVQEFTGELAGRFHLINLATLKDNRRLSQILTVSSSTLENFNLSPQELKNYKSAHVLGSNLKINTEFEISKIRDGVYTITPDLVAVGSKNSKWHVKRMACGVYEYYAFETLDGRQLKLTGLLEMSKYALEPKKYPMSQADQKVTLQNHPVLANPQAKLDWGMLFHLERSSDFSTNNNKLRKRRSISLN